MRLELYINELKQTSKDVETKITTNSSSVFEAKIWIGYVEDGEDYEHEFEFSAVYNTNHALKSDFEEVADLLEDKGHKGSWEIVFVDEEGDEVNPKERGIALKLFAAIIQMVEKLIKSKKPDSVFFTAKSNEPTKIKLYELLARKMVKLGGFKVTPFKVRGYKGWVFYK